MGKVAAGGVAAIVFFLAILALFVWIGQLLWNGVLTDVAPVEDISFWQMLGLFVLGRLMTGMSAGVTSNN